MIYSVLVAFLDGGNRPKADINLASKFLHGVW